MKPEQDRLAFDYEGSLTQFLPQGAVAVLLVLTPIVGTIITQAILSTINIDAVGNFSLAWLVTFVSYPAIGWDYYRKHAKFPCPRCFELSSLYGDFDIVHSKEDLHYISKEFAEFRATTREEKEKRDSPC